MLADRAIRWTCQGGRHGCFIKKPKRNLRQGSPPPSPQKETTQQNGATHEFVALFWVSPEKSDGPQGCLFGWAVRIWESPPTRREDLAPQQGAAPRWVPSKTEPIGIWVLLRIKQEGLRRFWSVFPLTRVPLWYRFFEPQPYESVLFVEKKTTPS